jgi:nitric oxide dioxygenase
MANAARRKITAREAQLIRQSFERAALNAAATSARFYQRLFTLEPAVRGLFHGDMREQGRKLMGTLTMIVDSVDQLESLLPTVRELGVRHANYRVEERHYATVGEALLWALEQSVGETFTSATRAAWAKAYAILADTMIEAARAAAASPAPASAGG